MCKIIMKDFNYTLKCKNGKFYHSVSNNAKKKLKNKISTVKH